RWIPTEMVNVKPVTDRRDEHLVCRAMRGRADAVPWAYAVLISGPWAGPHPAASCVVNLNACSGFGVQRDKSLDRQRGHNARLTRAGCAKDLTRPRHGPR